jgi:hypothetical protein
MRDCSEGKKGDRIFIFKTERDFFGLIEDRLEQEGFELLDVVGPMRAEIQPAQLRLQEGS